MTNEPATRAAAGLPPVAGQAAYQAELDQLRAREKAHTRAGDAIAAARRRLPMVEVDGRLTLTGPDGPVTLLDAFEGRRQLIAYYFMWYDGYPADRQCEGCTWCATQVAELSYLHSRDITYAVLCQGPYPESARYREFMGWDMPWYSAQASLAALLPPPRQPGRMHLVCYLRDGDHPHPEPTEVITANLLRVAGVTVTGVDIDELDAALAMAAATGAPVRVGPGRLMDQLAATRWPGRR